MTEATPHPPQQQPFCTCNCVTRLKSLEVDMKDLKSWKSQVDKFQQMLDTLRLQVQQIVDAKSVEGTSNVSSKEAVVPSTTEQMFLDNESETHESVVGGTKMRGSLKQPEEEEEEEDVPPIDRSSGIENVEITPDFFGHFLLDNDDDDVQMVEQDEVVVEEEGEEHDDEENNAKQNNSNKRKRYKRYEDSDSEDCYTLSDSDDDLSEEYTSDDDFVPHQKKHNNSGRGGRGRGRGSLSTGSSNNHHPHSIAPTTTSSSSLVVSGSSQKPFLDFETRTKLLRQCTKRPGDIWECKVCGFMLSSLENMLLHVKYNHSTTTHTCPFCRVVVLCRSPKDAMVHQAQCKMRPQGAKCRTPKFNSFNVRAKGGGGESNNNGATSVEQDIDAKVNKFVSDLLDPANNNSNKRATTTTSSGSSSSKGCSSSSTSAVVVTLSSDEDEDEDDTD